MIGEEAVSNRGRLFTVILSLFFFAVILTFLFAVIFLKFSHYGVDHENGNIEEEGECGGFQKYLMVNNEGETKKFESMKEINEFSLYEMEYGVRVYPMNIGSEMKEYLCECDLYGLEDYFSDLDESRRGLTMSSRRSLQLNTNILYCGILIAGGIAVMTIAYKSGLIDLRIMAENESEAEKIASEEISDRILSKIEIPQRGNANTDERDCDRCDELELEVIAKDEMIKELKRKIYELTSCTEVYPEDDETEEDQERRDFLVKCSGECRDTVTKEKLGQFSCIKFGDWEGESTVFGRPEVGLLAIDESCVWNFNVGVSELTYKCESIVRGSTADFFFKQDAYTKTSQCGKLEISQFFSEFNEFCETSFQTQSCYKIVQESWM